MNELEWRAVRGPGPQWTRTAACDEQGHVYLPAALWGSENTLLLCAGYDNEPVCKKDGHLFVRAEWLAKEYPHLAEELMKLAKSIHRRMAE